MKDMVPSRGRRAPIGRYRWAICALLFCVITSTIGTLQLFDENYVLTRGGPADATLTPVLYLYRVGFQQSDFGYAAAIAWAVVLLTGLISLAQFRLLGKGRI